MEKLGYLLITGFFVVITLITLEAIEEFYPDGLIILLIYGGLFVLFIKVLRERLSNKEDDYYSKEIRK
jgi:high-affinity Fe2+/Pb2+ permease|tara:strand:+ start:245 stop:448 length:204 start_codon:yes stop_codon:yes gene_type:complete